MRTFDYRWLLPGLLFGWLVAGVAGAALGMVGIWTVLDQRPWVRRTVAAVGTALLVITAIATFMEASIATSDLGSNFAADRELASVASRTAAIIAFCLLVGVAATARRLSPLAPPDLVLSSPHLRMGRDGWIAGGLVLALVSRLVWAPTALSPVHNEVAENIRSGIVFGRGSGFAAAETAVVTPLAPFIGAFAPLGERAALIGVGLITVALIVKVALIVGGQRLLPAVVVIAAMAPMLWAQQLPAALAAMATAAAVALLWREQSSLAQVVLAGVAVGAAALSRPEALLVLPVLIIWLIVRHQRVRSGVMLVAALITLLPWQLWVQRNFDTWLPTTSVGQVLAGASDSEVRSGADIGSWEPRAIATPASEATQQEADLDEARGRWGWHVLPTVVVPRVLRTWDMWHPGNAAHERNLRDLPYAGGWAGGLLQAVVGLLGILGAWQARARWRELFPLFGLPVAASIGAALTFGDRAFGAYAALGVVVLAAFGATAAWELMQDRLRRARAEAPAEPEPDLVG